MTTALVSALQALTGAVNLATGLTHDNDKNRAKETFKILHDNGEILFKQDIEAWALCHGWKAEDADQLGSLAQQIGEGKKVSITNGPWWTEGVYRRWNGEIQ
jgi:predicted NUDIX family NTP pyrophosphohydrolase